MDGNPGIPPRAAYASSPQNGRFSRPFGMLSGLREKGKSIDEVNIEPKYPSIYGYLRACPFLVANNRPVAIIVHPE